MQSSNSPPPQAFASRSSDDSKILQDLSTVSEQIRLCTSMLAQIVTSLPSTPTVNSFNNAVDSDSALLTVIGFLEACVPRMVELIQAGSSGGFVGEETMEKTLEVNDDLCRVLKDIDDPSGLLEKRGREMEEVREVGVAAAGNASLEEEFDAFGIGAGKESTVDGKSTLDDLLTLTTEGKSGGDSGDAKKEFDDFFGERTGGA